MKIVITGPKGSGKSTLGRELANLCNLKFIESDEIIEKIYFEKNTVTKNCREIFSEHGEKYFRSMEAEAVDRISTDDWCVISTGGGTLTNPLLKKKLLNDAILIFIETTFEILWERISAIGLPPFLSGPDGKEEFERRIDRLHDAVYHCADIVFRVNRDNQQFAASMLRDELADHMESRMFAPSTFGEIIRTTTFGESHGKALGAVLDGVPSGIELTENDIQLELDRRRPGQNDLVTPRNEGDRVAIVSGVFEGKTTGTPICMIVYNQDQDSSKYNNLKDVFRPGHADFTFWKKFGVRDHRGGGRSSGRETIGRVAGGAVADKIIGKNGIQVYAYAKSIGRISGKNVDLNFIEKNRVRAADPEMAELMAAEITSARESHDSVGGIVECIIRNVPAGLGDPVFYKLDARLGMALLSIGGVKGIEFGDGFAAASKKGSENNDAMHDNKFVTNHAGGILGGISNGEDIIIRLAVKPTPSIFRPQQTMDVNLLNREIEIAGRHDPCIVPRVIPVVESMIKLVIADALLIQQKMKQDNV